ncbi:hypothetical protein [Vibrio parahaemolyticus]|nr:hypothetical protein [Vibrio parahaemolyticus]MBY8145601.1 hypothetical protein [Vibrio fluvialis]HCG7068560.1 hypothetical protein [Vibrio parahaemolyticus]HDM8036840.1 hypothetical protein [Vibrio fluvialis clinical-1]
MIEMSFALDVYFNVDVKGLVQVAVDNAAAIKDLAAAVLMLTKASKVLRK